MIHLHRNCSRGKEISTHCPNQPHFLQIPEYIQFYWPTVLCLQPASDSLYFLLFLCSSQDHELNSFGVCSSKVQKTDLSCFYNVSPPNLTTACTQYTDTHKKVIHLLCCVVGFCLAKPRGAFEVSFCSFINLAL